MSLQKIEFRAMGCQMSAFIDDGSHMAAQALAQAPQWFEEWEQAFSRFRPSSELSQLNARDGQTTPLSEPLFRVIQASLDAAGWSGGLVTPALLGPLERAGYDRSFERIQPSSHGPGDGNAALAVVELAAPADAWREIALDEVQRTVFLPPGMKLDLGGIAKGWAAQQAVERLSDYGPALVNAGGDIAVSGPQADGSPWPVAVADPLQVQENLGVLMLERCGVATSGTDFRRWYQNGAWKHHIIDPRTGEPAQTDLVSATVVAGDALLAEAAAKRVMILGSQAGLAWLESVPELNAILALADGRVFYTSSAPDEGWR